MRDIQLRHRRVALCRLGDGHKVVVGMLEDFPRERFHEFEDARVFPLVLAEGLVIHKEIHHIAVAVNRIYPLRKLGRREGELLPATLAKTEGNIVGEFVVFEEELNPPCPLGRIEKVGTAPAKHMVSALG